MAKKIKPEEKRVILSACFDPKISALITQEASNEERSVSFILNRYLLSHPQIKRALKQRQAQAA